VPISSITQAKKENCERDRTRGPSTFSLFHEKKRKEKKRTRFPFLPRCSVPDRGEREEGLGKHLRRRKERRLRAILSYSLPPTKRGEKGKKRGRGGGNAAKRSSIPMLQRSDKKKRRIDHPAGRKRFAQASLLTIILLRHHAEEGKKKKKDHRPSTGLRSRDERRKGVKPRRGKKERHPFTLLVYIDT